MLWYRWVHFKKFIIDSKSIGGYGYFGGCACIGMSWWIFKHLLHILVCFWILVEKIYLIFFLLHENFSVEEIVECFGRLVDRAAGASTCPWCMTVIRPLPIRSNTLHKYSSQIHKHNKLHYTIHNFERCTLMMYTIFYVIHKKIDTFDSK